MKGMKRKVESFDSIPFNGEEHKKARTENPPSPVLHIRSLPDEVTEAEITNIAVPFGLIIYMVLTRKTGQALIEMESVEVAETMFKYYTQHPPHLKNKRCFIQYSIHRTLRAPGSSMHPEAENAVFAANQLCENMAKEELVPVLRFVIDDWSQDEITCLHIYKIFQHYGILEKVVVYVQKGSVQGFLQYSDAFSAKVAKILTNGLNVFPGSCTLKVHFSNRKTLDIGREDRMVRDFVRHPVTQQELKAISLHSGGGGMSRHAESDRGGYESADALAALRPMLDQMAKNSDSSLLRSLGPALQSLLEGYPRELHEPSRGLGKSQLGEKTSQLLIVSNLNETKVNPDVLFKLFGCYGDVTSVKIMYNRKNTALVQFVTEEQAQRALKYLNGINLYGKPLHVNFSKHDKINHRAPEPGSAEDVAGEGLHRDFLDHKLHRFRSSKSRNHVNIYEPSKVLHVAGLVDEATEEDVEALFQDLNFHIKKLRMFTSNNKKMALIELSNVESAVQALIALHGFDLGGLSLRVSFSKGQLN